ncbi:hypothetical protein PSN45_001619 [Yamadazyma tenuis]|nr:hypothetical protein PSN45_001619 [Yamadazyma tenuis]
MKLNKLNSTKYYGYNSLKPIGINKTMEQIDHENNLVVETNVTNTLENDLVEQNLNVEVDLDNQVPNFDSDGDNNDVIDALNDEDEGFMAEEVEYQNDHSLGTSIVEPVNTVSPIRMPHESSSPTTGTINTPFPTLVMRAEQDNEEDMILDDSS